MSLLNLLSLDDDQIEIITGAVRRWCQENNHELNSAPGQAAMEVAIRIATTLRPHSSEFSAILAREMALKD